MKHPRRIFLSWLPLGVAVTLLCGLVYATVQQNYRQSLNDPQIQLAEDVARLISNGASAKSIVPASSVDISASLAPWIAVYDANGNPIVSSGLLNNAMPQPPNGTFQDLTGQNSEDRVTWQPEPDVRQAIVVVPITTGGYVVAGRNMREVESRESSLELMVGIAWIITLIATFIAQAIAAALSA